MGTTLDGFSYEIPCACTDFCPFATTELQEVMTFGRVGGVTTDLYHSSVSFWHTSWANWTAYSSKMALRATAREGQHSNISILCWGFVQLPVTSPPKGVGSKGPRWMSAPMNDCGFSHDRQVQSNLYAF